MKKQLMLHGLQKIQEAIEKNIPIAKIWVDQTKKFPKNIFSLWKKMAIPYVKVPAITLRKMGNVHNRGIIAWVSPVSFSNVEEVVSSTFENGNYPLLALLDRITDVGNVGNIIRSGLAAGVNALVIPTKGCCSIHNQLLKSSSGGMLYLPICPVNCLKETILLLKKMGIKIIACSEKGKTSIFENCCKGATAFILGNEHDGVHPSLIQLSDQVCSIPTSPKMSSINVASAATLFFFKWKEVNDTPSIKKLKFRNINSKF